MVSNTPANGNTWKNNNKHSFISSYMYTENHQSRCYHGDDKTSLERIGFIGNPKISDGVLNLRLGSFFIKQVAVKE